MGSVLRRRRHGASVVKIESHEDTFPYRNGETWFRVVGDPKCANRPLVILHGGPGYPAYYLENLDGLAQPERAVIFYDQMSCGRSTGDTDPNSWTIEVFI